MDCPCVISRINLTTKDTSISHYELSPAYGFSTAPLSGSLLWSFDILSLNDLLLPFYEMEVGCRSGAGRWASVNSCSLTSTLGMLVFLEK